MTVISKERKRLKRRRRVRAKVSGTAARPRIAVFRSNRGISAQLIDDIDGRTLAAVNWHEPELRSVAKGERAARRPREGRRRPGGSLRSWRLPLPRSCPHIRRRRA